MTTKVTKSEDPYGVWPVVKTAMDRGQTPEVTSAWLKDKGASSRRLAWFEEHFPAGATVSAAVGALKGERKRPWARMFARWLIDAAELKGLDAWRGNRDWL